MAAIVDLCRFNPTAGSTTDWTFSSVVTGYQSPTLSNMVNGRVYKYRAESADLSQWELGEGTYNSGTGVLARTTVLYNSSGTGTATPGQSGAGTKINFTLAPQVAIIIAKEDYISIEEANAFTAAQAKQARDNIRVSSKGRIFGLALAPPGSTSGFNVNPGEAVDSTGADLMIYPTLNTKTTANWAVGNGFGSFDGTGASPASTAGWYHVHLIKRPDTGVVDVLTSLSATAPTLPANYTLFRRIGSVKTDGSFHWLPFTQRGDLVTLSSAVNELNTTTPATTLTALALAGVPAGVSTTALVRIVANSTAAAMGVLIASGDELLALNGVTGNRSLSTQVAGAAMSGQMVVTTDGSNQIKYQVDVATWNLFSIVTFGYIDRRGQDS